MILQKIIYLHLNQNKMSEKNQSLVVKSAREGARLGMQFIADRKASLQKEVETPENTCGLFSYNEENNESSRKLDLKKITNIKFLLQVLGFILQQDTNYNTAIKVIHLDKVAPFKWQGYTTAAWTEDIKKRIKIISFEEELKNLEEGSKILSKYLSEDDRMIEDVRKLQELNIIPSFEIKEIE
jgi:hypothetical protein